MPRPLVLFDLDGTLIRPGSTLQRMHMDAMAGAIAAVTGNNERFRYHGGELYLDEVNLAGFTDAGTIVAALVRGGIPGDKAARLVPSVVDNMVTRLHEAGTPEGWHGAEDLLPGSRDVVQALADAGFAIGMSTGNARAVAAWKMRHAGLSDLLRTGGFGDRATERVAVATAGVSAMTRGMVWPDGVLVGDTVSDVTAAHLAGLSCLAVTTGAASAEDLSRAGADVVLPGLAGREILPALLRLTDLTPATTPRAPKDRE